MSKIGEFELIERIRSQSSIILSDSEGSPDIVGIGDDCAVMPQRNGVDTLVTTDLLIEDRHFLLADISPEQLGWKAAAVNISDIAAMGGKPAAAFLSIALPPDLGERLHGFKDGAAKWVDRFITGFSKLCFRFGVPLLGGDTSASPDKLFINVTLLGECPHGQALLRSSACPGDLICVTGTLGDSAAGLKLVLERAASASQSPSSAVPLETDVPRMLKVSPEEFLIRRHYLPMPRVNEGRLLASLNGVHAMMDISDGIASDLRHVLKASSTGSATLCALIDVKALPLSDELQQVCADRGWDAVELAVSGGEDYELLFTIAPGTPLPEGCTVIGHIVDSQSGEWLEDGASAVGLTKGASADNDSERGVSEAKPTIRWIGSDKEYKGFTHF